MAVSGTTNEFLVFRLAGQELAVLASPVREVVRRKSATVRSVAGRGAVRLEWEAHGRWIPVISLAPLLGIREKPAGPRSCLVLLSYPDAAFLTDSISRVVKLPDSVVQGGRIKLGDKWRQLVDAPALMARAIQEGYLLRAG